jgi:hypothetical protein
MAETVLFQNQKLRIFFSKTQRKIKFKDVVAMTHNLRAVENIWGNSYIHQLEAGKRGRR